MKTTRLKSRLTNLERKLPPPKDATHTLEELCRATWRENSRDFLKIARNTSLGYFVVQFEGEDAERDRLTRQSRPTRSHR
jgi:hypothetical protein